MLLRIRAFLAFVPAVLILVACAFSVAFSQQGAGTGAEVQEETLFERENDPTAKLTQIQVKDIYTPEEYGTNAQPNTVQIRAVAAISPLALIPFEQLLRPTIKVVTKPQGKGSSMATGFDDMQLLDLLVMPWPNSKETHFRWGIGPYFVFPTSTTNLAGQGSWQLGPAFGFAYRGIPRLNLSGILQQATSFAYTSAHSPSVTSITFQPLLTYRLWRDWYLKSSDATWTFHLRHNSSTTIPLSAGLGRVWKLSDAYALDGSISGEWMVYRKLANKTEQFSLNFQVALLLPKTEF